MELLSKLYDALSKTVGVPAVILVAAAYGRAGARLWFSPHHVVLGNVFEHESYLSRHTSWKRVKL